MEASYISVLQEERGGFDFGLLKRNDMLLKSTNAPENQQLPYVRKTGTTICGIVTTEGIILGADTRATEGPIVADKKCQKLHRLADNIWAAGAGTAADLDHTTALIESGLELFRLSMGRSPRVSSAVAYLSQLLFKYQGHVCCAIVLGGVDCCGPALYEIHPHGSTDRLPFCCMGSGSLNALAVLESQYRENMTLAEGQALVAHAIQAGIYNDLGSGGNVDIVTINVSQNATYFRGWDTTNESTTFFRDRRFVAFPLGITPVLKSEVKQLWQNSVVVEDVDMTTVGVSTS